MRLLFQATNSTVYAHTTPQQVARHEGQFRRLHGGTAWVANQRDTGTISVEYAAFLLRHYRTVRRLRSAQTRVRQGRKHTS